MANIPGVRFDITGASGSTGLLGPKDAWKAYVFPRGGHASADSTGSLITFDSATIASRFSVNDWIQAGTLTANLRKVSAVGGNSISFGGAVMTVTENQRIFRIGTTQPGVSGGSATYIPLTTIRQRGDDTADVYTNSMVTTNSDGLVQFYTAPNMYDVLVQDGNQSNQGYIADLEVGTVEGVSVIDAAYFGSTVTFSGSIGSTLTVVQGVSIGQGLTVAYDTKGISQDVAIRVGVRAQTTGIVDEKYLIYASESYTSDLSAANETFALYGINQISGNIAAGADAHGVVGEVQFNPSTAKTATAPIIGVQGIARYSGTHASAVAASVYAGSFSAVSSGTTGTVTALRSINVGAPTNSGGAAVTNAASLVVVGPVAGVGSAQNLMASFSGGTDEACDVLFNSAPIRIDDDDNAGNSAAAGRWVDIYRDWDGADVGTPLFAGVHMTLNLEGTFTSGDDGYGIRSIARTGTASGDGTNLDIIGAFEGLVDHRSNVTVDELYGIDLRADHTTGSGIVSTQAGFRALPTVTAGQTTSVVYGGILNSVTPIAGHSSCGHMKLVPVSSATPATTLALLTGAESGSIIYIEDVAGQSNSGFFFRMKNQWRRLDDTTLSVPTD